LYNFIMTYLIKEAETTHEFILLFFDEGIKTI
jgi:hypothetical protein